jgi:hypothetical protein
MIEKHILDLQDAEKFFNYVIANSGYWKNMEESYEAAERLYFANFQRRRYANYETFKSTKSRFFKQLKENK